jgi:hypothetical protein
MGVDVLHKIFVLAADRAHRDHSVKAEQSLRPRYPDLLILKFATLCGVLTRMPHTATFERFNKTNCDGVVIMSSEESHEPARSVYDSCDPKYLRELREASGMDLFVLARTACLSVAQVRQLESDAGGHLFYSATIKQQAYKRLLMILGAEPPTAEVSEEFRLVHQVPQAHLNTLDQIVAMSHQPAMQRSRADALRAGLDKLGEHKQVLSALLLLLVAIALFMIFGQPQNVAQTLLSKPAPPAPVMAVPQPAVVTAPSASVAVAVAMIPAPSATCAYTEDALPELTPYAANKEGRYVYLVSSADTEVCVVDSQKKATALPLKAGESRSVYGAPPWQISAPHLQKIQIYFQGGRVTLSDATVNRIKLIELPVSR